MRNTLIFFKSRFVLLLMIWITLSLSVMGQSGKINYWTGIQKGFVSPPDSVQTSIYWYWISDNISKEGVEKDLEAMKRVGINRAFIGNIGLNKNETRYDKVKIFSDEWWAITHAALKKATELNIEIGIFNSPGWSQSGGPWVKPEQAMRYLSSTQTIVKGGTAISQKLPAPEGFQDVKVIAFPAPADYGTSVADLRPVVSVMPSLANAGILLDGDTKEDLPIPPGEQYSIDSKNTQPYTARNIVIYPAHRNMKISVELQAEQDGSYHTIKKFMVDRSN
ncbi:MAG: hypothetical protein IT250_04165, partial [Chitinophagaceae bacterium]|nr:hypothetical protein [Chitinophagaceae bacterium]